MWTKISNYAQKLWEDMGHNIEEQEILVAQMLNFKESKVLMQRLLLKIVLHHVHGGCPVKINLLLQNNWC